MGQTLPKYMMPSTPYGSSPTANSLIPSQAAAQNPQSPQGPQQPQQSPLAPQGLNPFLRGPGRFFGALLLFLLLPFSVKATTTFTGTIQNLNAGNVTTGTYVRFWLRGCGGNQPRVVGTSIIAPSLGGVFYFDFIANGSGAVSGTLYSTRDSTGLLGGDITCGTSRTSVYYGMQIFVNGKGGPEVPIHAQNGVAFDISSVSLLSTTPVPTPSTVIMAGSITGCVTTDGVAFENGVSNTLTCGGNFLWNTPIAGALNVSSAGIGTTTCTGTTYAFQNTNAGLQGALGQYSDGSVYLRNDCASIPNKGFFAFEQTGVNGDVDLRAGANGSSLYMSTVANTGGAGNLPAGSIYWSMPNTGVGTAKFQMHQGTAQETYQWDSGNGCSTWFVVASSTNGAVLCPPTVATTVPQELTATSSAFATATTAGTCVQNTTAVANAATTMAVVVSPVSTPGVGAVWSAFVSSAGNVTINECAVATSAGGTIAFNIRVIL